jgi:hypothetical protein
MTPGAVFGIMGSAGPSVHLNINPCRDPRAEPADDPGADPANESGADLSAPLAAALNSGWIRATIV